MKLQWVCNSVFFTLFFGMLMGTVNAKELCDSQLQDTSIDSQFSSRAIKKCSATDGEYKKTVDSSVFKASQIKERLSRLSSGRQIGEVEQYIDHVSDDSFVRGDLELEVSGQGRVRAFSIGDGARVKQSLNSVE